MTAARRVLLVGHDRGGTNLLVPLLRRWSAPGTGIEASFLGTPVVEYEVGEMLARASGLPPVRRPVLPTRALAWDLDEAELDALLADGGWDCVLTGTSAVSTMEKTTWRLARARGIPCAAICDMWTEYRRRLEGRDGELLIDHMLVVDERMADDIRTTFDGRVRATVTGNPHFADLLARNAVSGRGSDLRFISEPANALFPDAHVHEFDVAKSVIVARDKVRPALPVVIRPHPQDDSEGWRRFVFANRAQDVRLDADPSWVCPETTRMAVGLSSMMLIELAIAGVPAASFRPAGANPSYFCLNESEFGIAVIRDEVGLADWIAAPEAPKVARSVRAAHGDAIDRITAGILAGTLIA